jgi:hypothetical protein
LIAFGQSFSLGDVVALTSSQFEAQGVAQSIDTDMDFGLKPPRLRPRAWSAWPLVWPARLRHTDALE